MKKVQSSLKITVVLAFLTALSIILGKYLAIRGGDVMRFSLENMPIIFAGMAFGPWAGVLVGVTADLIGCLMVGYTVNPLVTLGAGAIGAISGCYSLLVKKMSLSPLISTVVTVGASHIVGSLFIKTLGLAAYYSMPFGILLLWRILNYAIVGALDGTAVYILLNNKGIKMQLSRLTERK